MVRDWYAQLTKPPVPSEQPRANAVANQAAVVPVQINLSVPFVPQAPYGIWDYAHDEFCEEASALMGAAYVSGDVSVARIDIAEQRLQAVRDWEMKTFGYFEDTTAAQTARILREYLGVTQVRVIADPTVGNLKAYLAEGKIVLVPAAGVLLHNPHFRAPGPVYHMLVLKGYTKDGQFITNDPGTKYGANYLYPFSTLMNAMHDWNNGADITQGAKVVIVVG